VNPQLSRGVPGPVGSNIEFSFSGNSVYGCIQICYFEMHTIDFGLSLSSFDVLAAIRIKKRDSQSLPYPANECQRSVNNF